MGQLKKVNFTLALLSILFSCVDSQDNFIKRQIPVDIYESTIPTNGAINQDIQIQLRAQATNGCYSDLEIKLIEIDRRHFLFKATGLFQTNGICPDIMVYKDTIINFRPTLTGNYFFRTNEDSFEIRKDTVDIN